MEIFETNVHFNKPDGQYIVGDTLQYRITTTPTENVRNTLIIVRTICQAESFATPRKNIIHEHTHEVSGIWYAGVHQQIDISHLLPRAFATYQGKYFNLTYFVEVEIKRRKTNEKIVMPFQVNDDLNNQELRLTVIKVSPSATRSDQLKSYAAFFSLILVPVLTLFLTFWLWLFTLSFFVLIAPFIAIAYVVFLIWKWCDMQDTRRMLQKTAFIEASPLKTDTPISLKLLTQFTKPISISSISYQFQIRESVVGPSSGPGQGGGSRPRRSHTLYKEQGKVSGSKLSAKTHITPITLRAPHPFQPPIRNQLLWELDVIIYSDQGKKWVYNHSFDIERDKIPVRKYHEFPWLAKQFDFDPYQPPSESI